MKIRVCHIAATADGASWMVEQLRDLRNRKGCEVSAIIASGEGELGKRLSQLGIPFHTFDFEFPAQKGWRSLLKRVVALSLLLRRERYDVVHTHLFASMVLGRLAGWLADVPVRLAMIAGPYHLEAYTPRWIDISTCWMEAALIASCEYTRTLYKQLGVSGDRVLLVYYGPDESKFDRAKTSAANLREEFGWHPQTLLIGMVAYFYPALPASRWTPSFLHGRANKRHEDLIRAAPLVLREFPDARFLLVGSAWGEAGERELQHARNVVAELGLEKHVVFTGYRSDVNSILVALDVTVQASLSENLGGTIESLLMRCPTVATRSGGLIDSIKDGETGILVSPLDPADLATGILRVLRSPDEAMAQAARGQALMQAQFTLTQTVDKLDRIYRTQLSSGDTQQRVGYRLVVSAGRATLALPVFAHLALRLAWDTRISSTILPRLLSIWRRVVLTFNSGRLLTFKD